MCFWREPENVGPGLAGVRHSHVAAHGDAGIGRGEQVQRDVLPLAADVRNAADVMGKLWTLQPPTGGTGETDAHAILLA